MKILAVIGQKGGNAKTTTALGVAVAATAAGHTVAVIDLESTAEQGNEGKNLKALLGEAINLLADRYGNVYAQVLAE